ncbi:MAG: hypothetical protein MJZ29_06035 [Bacteroidaceae bacterium]|nr:hypothetical protein [Bacteroidaceae bacterium]
MKTKLYYLFAMLFMAFTFVACGDDPEDEPKQEPIHSHTEEFNVSINSADAQSVERSFTITETWKATSNADWCTVSPAQGTAGEGKKITSALQRTLIRNLVRLRLL